MCPAPGCLPLRNAARSHGLWPASGEGLQAGGEAEPGAAVQAAAFGPGPLFGPFDVSNGVQVRIGN